MEKKSLGAFIARLRKEKGLTQKQLAELLNVSDKTVSHWECDETSPDISLLSELAGNLGVTVDELLNGEKKADCPNFTSYSQPFKGEGFFDKVSKKTSSFFYKIKDGDISYRYRYFCLASLVGATISAVAILTVALSTLLSARFFASRTMVSIIVLIGSLWTVALSMLFTLGGRFLFSKKLIPDSTDTPIEKTYIYKSNKVTFNNLLLVFSVFPLALTGIDILPVGINFAVTILLMLVLRIILIVVLTKKGIFGRNEKEMLLIKKSSLCLILLAVGAGIHLFAVEVYHPTPENMIFYSAEEFKAYMETPKDKPEYANRSDITAVCTMAVPTLNESFYENNTDENSVVQAPPQEEDFVPTDTIIDRTGKTVVSFKLLNNEVYTYSYLESEGTFHVITYEARLKQQDTLIFIEDGSGILMHLYYAAVIAGCFACYLKQKKKIRTEPRKTV